MLLGGVADLIAEGGIDEEALEFVCEISGIERFGEEAGDTIEDFFAGTVNVEGDGWAAGEGGFAAQAREMRLGEGDDKDVALRDQVVYVGAFAGEGDMVMEIMSGDDVAKLRDVGLAAKEASEARAERRWGLVRNGTDEQTVEGEAARAEDSEGVQEKMDALGFGETAEVGDERDIGGDVEFLAERVSGGTRGLRLRDKIEDANGAGMIVQVPTASFAGEHENERMGPSAREMLEESAAEAGVAGMETFKDVEDDGAAGARGGGKDAGQDHGVDVNDVRCDVVEEGACGTK